MVTASDVLAEARRHEAVVHKIACDMEAEIMMLRHLVAEARDMFERGDFDARDDQRKRLADFLADAKEVSS